jgi:hypothetical protein
MITTTRRAWSEVKAIYASEPLTFDEYVTEIGDAKLLIDILVGDFQRVIEYPAFGYANAQDVPRPSICARDSARTGSHCGCWLQIAPGDRHTLLYEGDTT